MPTPAEVLKRIAGTTEPMQKIVETLLSKNPEDPAKVEQLTQNEKTLKSFNEEKGPKIVEKFEEAKAIHNAPPRVK